MSVLQLARPELVGRRGYTAAIGRFDLTRLHANEMPNLDGEDEGLNRYPPPRPVELTRRLGEVIGVSPERLLITRGSNEGIDLLARGFCRSGTDSVVICPPTFGMYRVCAEVQGAKVYEVPLDDAFDLDTGAIIATVDEHDTNVKLVFLCSPANPTGAHLSIARVEALCAALSGKALVVLDQAYIEFNDNARAGDLLDRFDNLVLLRTFSKAYGLAGLRCGVVIANEDVIALLDSLLAPYSTPTPVIDGVLAALTPEHLERCAQRLAELDRQKKRVQTFLEHSPLVSRIYPSDSNFFLIQSPKAQALYDHLLDRGILVRSFITTRRLENGLRITVGNSSENARLFAAFEELGNDA